jgi:predicted transcriptional regulator
MSASKKRRRLPDEDLAAAVADIINSPITRPNLSFLRQPPSSPLELNTVQRASPEDTKTGGLEPNTLGAKSNSDGVETKPVGLDPATSELECILTGQANQSSETKNNIDRPEHSKTDWEAHWAKNQFETPGDQALKPTGLEAGPPGLGSATQGFENQFSSDLIARKPNQQDSRAEIPRWEPLASNRPLWQAEGLATLFEQSRVKRIRQAQDALSLVEEKVYDLLWGPKNQQKDEFRLVHYSLQRVANEARVNIKTVRELIPRLIDKGFLQIEHEADVRRNIPTLYRVFSYSSVLNHQRQRQRFHVVKTGKGVFYVHPVSAALQLRPHDENAAPETPDPKPGGLDQKSAGVLGAGFVASPAGYATQPYGPNTTGPMGARSPKPMGYSGQVSLDNLEDTIIRQTSTSCWAKLAGSIREWLSLEADDQLLRGMIIACHRNAIETTGQPATESELVYFTANKASILSRTPNIRNHLAVLRKAVPECFLGETFRAYRLATEAHQEKQRREEQDRQSELEHSTQEEEARCALWSAVSERHRGEQGYDMQAILNDPDLDEQGREQARGILKRLGRFTQSGI